MDFITSSAITATGVLACALSVGSYAAKTHRRLTFTAVAAVLMWALHFGLQRAWTPCVLSVLMSARVAAGAWVIHLSWAQRWWATVAAWALALVAAGLTWKGVTSVPSTLATLFLSWAGMHLDIRQLRWALLVGEGLWFVNGWVVGSPLAMVSAVLAIGLNSWMLWKQLRMLRLSTPEGRAARIRGTASGAFGLVASH